MKEKEEKPHLSYNEKNIYYTIGSLFLRWKSEGQEKTSERRNTVQQRASIGAFLLETNSAESRIIFKVR